jgi:broad-specificity NMP kinase
MWSQSGNYFTFFEKDNEQALLPAGIYSLEIGPFGNMFLNLKQPKFEFNYKLYGCDGFPERVIRTYRTTNNNLGVLLCGLKGTGKTVQAEQICNLSNMPVIIVSQDFNEGKGLIKFLSIVNQEVVVLIDEYEKIFGKSEGLLSIMDGVLNGTHRRMFVLTANTMHISEALIDRPSRIHYLKRFSNLDIGIIGEVVDDMLEAKQFREEVINYLSILEIVTIDIVKTVVSEVNRFMEPPQNFKDILNVTIHDQTRWEIKDTEGTVLIQYGVCDLLDPLHYQGYELRLKEFGNNYTNFGCIKTTNKKTGKIVTDKGTYFIAKAKSFSAIITKSKAVVEPEDEE